MPDKPEPYDICPPFDANRFLDGFIEEERTIHAEDDPTLVELAARAEQARRRLFGDESAGDPCLVNDERPGRSAGALWYFDVGYSLSTSSASLR